MKKNIIDKLNLFNEKYINNIRIVALISIISAAIDIFFRYSCVRTHTEKLFIASVLDNTLFDNKMATIVSVLTTIISVTFSFFSYASTKLINSSKKYIITEEYFELLGIKATYNKYVFLAIGFQCFAFQMGWGTLFYMMVLYQIYSFKICLSNYLTIIDNKKLNKKIEDCENENKDNDDVLFKLLYNRILAISSENSFFLDFDSTIFKWFDDFLFRSITQNEQEDSNLEAIVPLYYNKCIEIVKKLLDFEKNRETKNKMIYTLLIIIAPNNIIKQETTKSLKIFNLDEKNSVNRKLSYVLFYYSLVFNILDFSPESLNNRKFEKILTENTEICELIIMKIQFEYQLNNYISNNNLLLYNHVIKILTSSPPKYTFSHNSNDNDTDNTLITEVLWYIWLKNKKQKMNFYTIGQQYETALILSNLIKNNKTPNII